MNRRGIGLVASFLAVAVPSIPAVAAPHRGGMLISASDSVLRLSKTGTETSVVDASAPGQLVWHGKRVIVPTGDSAQSGALDRSDGTLELLNPTTGKVTPYATGLTMPNGLAVAPNGTAINRKTSMMYVDRTFSENAAIIEIPLRDPHHPKQIGNLAGVGSAVPKGLDDLIIGADGVLYLPGNGSGEVFSFDPASRQSCVIVSGLQDPSAIAVGTGHGWRRGSLFVCGFDGTVRELDPLTT